MASTTAPTNQTRPTPPTVTFRSNVHRARARFTGLGLDFTPVTALLVNRISAEDSRKLETQTDSGAAKYVGQFGELVAVEGRAAWVFEAGGKDRARATAERDRLGMRAVFARDISSKAKDPGGLVGFASVVGRVLVLDVMNSAAEDNIVDGEDIDGFGRNLFTELVRSVVVAFDDRLRDLLFSRWDRLLRSSRHGSSLKETIGMRGHLLTLWIDGVVKDPNALGSEVEQMVAVTDNKGNANKQFSGAYSISSNGEWPKAAFQLPDGAALGTGKTKHVVHWVPGEVAIIAELFAMRAAGASIAAVTVRAVELRLRVRQPHHRKQDGTFPTLGELFPGATLETAFRDRLAREALVASRFEAAKRRVYRTGVYLYRLVAPAAGRSIVDGAVVGFATGPDPVWHRPSLHTTTPKDLRLWGFRDFELNWGLPTLPDGYPVPDGGDDDPVEGLNLRASQWNRLDALYSAGDLDGDDSSAPALNRGAGGAASTDDDECRPFLGLATWLDRSTASDPQPGEESLTDSTGHPFRRVERKISGGNPESLTVRERCPQTRGWATNEGALTVTIPDRLLARSVAAFLAGVVSDDREGRIEFIATRRPGSRDDKLDGLRSRRDEAAALATAKSREARGHRANAAAAAADHPEPESAAAAAAAGQYRADAARATAEAERAQADVDRLDRDLAHTEAVPVRRVTADLTRIAVLAEILQSGAQVARPRWVREVGDALTAVFRDTFRLVPDPTNHRLAWWTGTAHITVDGEDLTYTAPRTPVMNLRRPRTEHDAPAVLAEAFAAVLLREGKTLSELFDLHPRSGSNALTLARGWISRHGVTRRGLVAALVDCPIPATKLAAWSSLADDPGSAAHLLPGFRTHIADVYTGQQRHHSRWLARDTTLPRRAINALLSLPDPAAGVAITDLARTLGVTPAQVNLLTDGGSAQYWGILVKDSTNRRRVRLRPCPYEDCGSAPGNRWASHFLPVPETLVEGGHGLLCPDCLRLPHSRHAQVVFPGPYLQAWDLSADANRPGRTLRDGSLVTLGSPDRYRPAADLPTRPVELNVHEAAAHLGVSATALRGWSNSGKVRCRRLQHGPGAACRGYAVADLDRIKDASFVVQWKETFGRPDDGDATVGTLKEVIAWANVGDWHIRDRVAAGTLPAHRGRASDKAALLFAWDDVRACLTENWRRRHSLDNLSVGDVVRRSGLSPTKIHCAATTTGLDGEPELRSYVTDGGTRVFTRPDVENWLARPDRPSSLLTPKRAAAAAGIDDTDVLRRAAASGQLAMSRTAGGHARYAAADITAWAAGHPSSLRQSSSTST